MVNEEDPGAGKQKRRMFWNQEHQKKKKAEKWDAQQGAIRRDSVQNAGGEYIKKPILPKTYFTYVVFQRHTFSVKGTQNIPFT